MKLIIAGSRNLTCSVEQITSYLLKFDLEPTVVISGQASGIDECGEQWAHAAGISLELYPVTEKDWAEKGRAAGPIRNGIMAKAGDILLLIWDGKSRGSKNMKEQMLRLKKPVYEILL